MAYTWSLHWNGSTGPKSTDGGQEYEAWYRVISDDADDQSQKVVEWFELNVVAIGDPYSYANDSDANAVAKRIDPDREKGSTTIWVVKVHYAPRGSGEFNFEFVQEDLELRCEDVSATSIQHQIPVEDAIYWSGFTGDSAVRMPPNTKMMPSNSVPTPFNPGLEMDQAGWAVRIVFRLAAVDGGLVKQLMNSVNNTAFTLAHCNFTLPVEQYQARIVSASLALRSEEGRKYWELPIVMEIIEGYVGKGWRPMLVDRGTHARAAHGDPDGRGGTISPGDGTDMAGLPRIRELVDSDETPLSDPVPFDGNGQPLPPDGAVRRVLLEYQIYPKEIDFKTVPLFQGLFS